MPPQPFVSWREVIESAADAGSDLLLIVIIFGGNFTPTQAAVAAVVYALIITNLMYNDMGPRPNPIVGISACSQSPGNC